jgi:hypothetical protein
MDRVQGSIARRVTAVTGRAALALGIGVAALALVAAAAEARPARPFAARAGVDLAMAAARAWSADAALVYVENDEDVDADGAAARWGYLVYSPSRARARAYSVRDGKLLVAEDLDLRVTAPPLAGEWIDSGTARAAAEREARRVLRKRETARLTHMVLVRGPFDDRAPDETTWTLVYAVSGAPALYVVVDAAGGQVRRTWRG